MKRQRTQGLSELFIFTAAVVIIASSAMRYISERVNHPSAPDNHSYSLLGLLRSEEVGFTFTTIAEASTQGKASMNPALAAVKLIQSEKSFTVKPLEKFTFEVGYKNNGINNWELDTDPMKTITLRSRARSESYFYDPSWNSGTIVMNVPSITRRGELAYFRFTLEAPKKEGSYTEHLSLYHGDKQIKESTFDLPIVVSRSKQEPIKPLAASIDTSNASSLQIQKKTASLVSAQQDITRFLEAYKLIQSDTALKLSAGEEKVFEVGYKNIGRRAWKMSDLPHITLRAFTDKERSVFYDAASWNEPRVATYLQTDAETGQVSYVRFFVKAPTTPGSYKETFYLSFGDEPVVGSDFILPMEVIAPQNPLPLKVSPLPLPVAVESKPSIPERVQQPSLSSEQLIPSAPLVPQSQSTLAFAGEQQIAPQPVIKEEIKEQEPLIRIGYVKTNDPVTITAASPYQIRVGGVLLSTQAAGTVATVSYEASAGLYTSTINGVSHTSVEPPRFTGVVSDSALLDPETIFEIISYQNRPAWSSEINDNTIRGAVEVRYSPEIKALWVINELPLEYYLRGLAETSNNSPYEFQKALIIAARTYAKYHIDYGSKYPRDGFTIRSTDHDQVYRGYGAEKRLPNVRKAVEETRGVIVTYQGKLAITPYYSQSDGRTRSWEEVWAGTPKPWLVGKEDPPGRGLPLLGHGVGMAARGAIVMAIEGKSFDDILKYYYTGIELTKRY